MSMYPGSVTPEPPLLPDMNSSLITFNVAALQTMMQAVAREVAERVRRESLAIHYVSLQLCPPHGIHLHIRPADSC